MELTPKDEARFWSKVDKTSDCWIWTSSTRNGYGTFRIGNKVLSAHRLSYCLAYGEPGRYQVRHTCDNPPCVNPKHLELGNAKQNSDDKMVRDRHGFKLSNAQVMDLKSREVTQDSIRQWAKEFGLTATEIRAILGGEKYSWIEGTINIPPQNTAYKLSAQQVNEILKELQNPYWGQVSDLARQYHVTPGTISHIKRRRLKYSRTDT